GGFRRRVETPPLHETTTRFSSGTFYPRNLLPRQSTERELQTDTGRPTSSARERSFLRTPPYAPALRFAFARLRPASCRQRPGESATSSTATVREEGGTGGMVDHRQLGVADADLYAVLGLKKECSDADLRLAYRRLAMTWHPDRCSASGSSARVQEAKERFQEIQSAYSDLSAAAAYLRV
uniref:J domain-containing protein n=1 Tax=Aegilops tauschii subsp. strangulata TaxID=200361 RepID=A0A453R0Q6_AEGTS